MKSGRNLHHCVNTDSDMSQPFRVKKSVFSRFSSEDVYIRTRVKLQYEKHCELKRFLRSAFVNVPVWRGSFDCSAAVLILVLTPLRFFVEVLR